MKQIFFHALSLASLITLTSCGGGGGGGSSGGGTVIASTATTSSSSSSSSSSNLSSSSSSSSATSLSITFKDVSVHDPAMIKVNGTYYIFGSHGAAASSTDLMNWTSIADGVTASNSLFNDVTKVLADTFKWTTVTDLWAPDVIRLDDGKFYYYYDSCQGSSPLSAMGISVSDTVTGPYANQSIFLKSGGAGSTNLNSDGATTFDVFTQPNVVDPNVFYDKNHNLWMTYGSYSGGIFILSMDKTTGLPVPGQGWGKRLIGEYNATIEGSYIMYSPDTNYYYLFVTYGGLAANGGYNIRVARSNTPDGPYYDASGKDMSTVIGNQAVFFDNTKIAPYGQKLMGNYQFALAAGETGTPLGYVSPGGTSPYYDTDTHQYYLVFHTRFPGMGEFHQVRVHQFFMNQDGWIVVAPFRYAPLSLSDVALSADVAEAEVAGSYKYINHGKDITSTIVQSQVIQLTANHTITGAVTGTWAYNSNNYIDITLDNGGLFRGVLSRQWNSSASKFEVTFTAQSNGGVSIWGARTGN